MILVARRIRLGRQKHRAIVRGERLQLRVDLRVVPVGPSHRRFEIVDHQPLGHAAEMSESVLQTVDEGVGSLSPDRFAVAVARMREHDAEDPRPPSLAIPADDWCAATEIDCASSPGSVSIRRQGNSILCRSRAT
jgi:hypothetical protein